MKTSKTPAIGPQTKVLSFDIESNGLHGKPFAVAAVVVDMNGLTQDTFVARIKINDDVDEWVAENVLPVMTDMPITHGSYRAMCDSFWRWFTSAQEQSDYVVVSNGYPVEYRFLADCQDDDIVARYWEHPFPILDLTSLLIGHGVYAEKQRLKLLAKTTADRQLKRHNPLDDAQTTALTTITLLSETMELGNV